VQASVGWQKLRYTHSDAISILAIHSVKAASCCMHRSPYLLC
jgi:hypothetical protein